MIGNDVVVLGVGVRTVFPHRCLSNWEDRFLQLREVELVGGQSERWGKTLGISAGKNLPHIFSLLMREVSDVGDG